MNDTLILYSTTDGHTKKICTEIKSHLENLGHSINLLPVEDYPTIDLNQYDKLLIGASIRYGKHNQQVYNFIHANHALLNQKPSAFFSVNLVARKPEKNQPNTNPYMRKFLTQIPWKPKQLAVFAGKLNYARYGFFDRWMIRFIMYITNGPTQLDTVVEFTDWQQVKQFAQQFAHN